MGEHKEAQKNEQKEKKPEAAAKKKDGPVPTVLKVNVCCKGCVQRVEGAIRQVAGVENVKADVSQNKVKVFGKVDPAKVIEKLAKETKKKAELISGPPPEKDAGAGDKKPKEEKKLKTAAKKDASGGDKKPKEENKPKVAAKKDVGGRDKKPKEENKLKAAAKKDVGGRDKKPKEENKLKAAAKKDAGDKEPKEEKKPSFSAAGIVIRDCQQVIIVQRDNLPLKATDKHK